MLDVLTQNTEKAIPAELKARYQVAGYEWGDVASPLARAKAGTFTRILAADCYWMPHEHQNLVKSMMHMLDDSRDSRIFVVSGRSGCLSKSALMGEY